MTIDGQISPYKQKITNLFKVAESVLGEDFSNANVSINFVDENEIQRLNKTFRNIDRKTDVLSFPNLDKKPYQKLKEFDSEKNIDDGQLFLGDIVICKPVAKAQAKEFGHSETREICYLALHSLLHLLGYDHIEKADEEIMNGLASEIMSKFGVER